MKTDVLLIHPLYGEETEQRICQPGIESPISLLYLSAYLEKEGIGNDILDLRMEGDPRNALYEKIKEGKPLVAGITASTAAIENAAEVAKRIKSFDGKIVTVLGGWHASALPEETLKKYPQFDYLIHGEGEIALTNFIKCIEGRTSAAECKGLALRNNGKVRVNPREELITDLDTIPYPARLKVPVKKYHPKPGTRNYLRLPSTGILVGRGCPYRCLFCYKGVWGKSLRFRTPENVLQEIEMCIDQYGIRDFRFYDDTVTFPRWDLKSLCEEIINRKLNISWNCWSRVNDVDEEKLGMMKEAGCYNIKFGIEFGTAKALKLANKGATLEQARRAVAMTKKAGIECKGSFIFGIPGETIEDCRKTIDFAKDISPHFATFFAFDPIPGSPFYERIIQEEIKPEKDMLPREMAQDLSNQAYLAFYFRPTFIFQRIHSLFRHPKREISMVSSGLFMLTGFWLKKMKRLVLSTIRMEAATMSEMACDLENKAERLSTFEKMAIRVMDFSVATVVLVLSLPVMILLAMIIKIDSPGPAIFKQIRTGKDRRNGSPETGWNNGEEFLRERRQKDMWSRPFVFYKFRTMYVDAREKYPELYRYEYSDEEIRNMCFKRAVDPRLTPFGQHLRKTTFDEFPNLINVIKGDMGLVGPRPDIPEMIKYYKGWQRKKFQIKPGVTGLAQISGRGLLNFQDTLKYDVEMVEKYGFWFNARIILKTIKVTVLRIGAF